MKTFFLILSLSITPHNSCRLLPSSILYLSSLLIILQKVTPLNYFYLFNIAPTSTIIIKWQNIS